MENIMETYSVRGSDGTLIASLVGAPAENIFKNLDGSWETYQAKDKKRTVAYVIERDSIWETETRVGACRIYLWAGTKIIKD
jgi:hypothetical protein